MELPGIAQTIKFLYFVFASWLLTHAMAAFGIFLAIAYPVWLLFTPSKTSCLICRIKKDGEWCPFCRRVVDKEAKIRSQPLVSVLLNGGLIIILTLLSLAVVFVESRVLSRLGFPPTPKTVSFRIPPKGQYRLGETFSIKVEIEGIEGAVNTIQADLGFNPETLEAVEISTSGSFANIFIQKEINNEMGYARLTGGLPNPGFLDKKGIFGTVFFQGKKPGIAKIEFLPSSLVLANDGHGTNVLKDLASVSYLILPEEISEDEKQQQEVLLKPIAMGETGTAGQLKLYQEERVLGAQVGEEAEKKQGLDLKSAFLGNLERLDRWTLTLWREALFP
jgi:hypothetical protein